MALRRTMMHECPCPDLLHEMLTMLAQIRDELRQIRQVLLSNDVEALVALHRRLRAPDEAD